MAKQTALVICPGRGTYNKAELGYLRRWHSDKQGLMHRIDNYRAQCSQTLISELDGADSYNISKHTRGDNASALVYACAYADFLSIDRDEYEIVAVTGNSLGWYVALGCANALPEPAALQLINTMGTLMHKHLNGGQVIYPIVDEQWREIPGRRQMLLDIMQQVNSHSDSQLYISIQLGGFLVYAGNEAALKYLSTLLPVEQQRFPMRLHNHSAFHSPLLQSIAKMGHQSLPPELFQQGNLPMIDGRGHIWQAHSSDTQQLWDYTLGQQVITTYDFSKAVQVAVREFAPDRLIILGPGSTLGGAVAQSLIEINWQGLSCKQDFIDRQQSDEPLLISMGLEAQRSLATG
ncbi:MAG: ACP S-malonyltransferase [Pseudomonadales bacterium]|nr:ACP S-malonyltransferase [Pseudomonadales bacterium]